MGRNRSLIPDRWEEYSISGSPIPKTPFVAIKTPLKKELDSRLSEKGAKFNPAMMLDLYPNIGMVVDLTDTNRYYNKEEITRLGIAYEKIRCPGRVMPPDPIIRRFPAYFTSGFQDIVKRGAMPQNTIFAQFYNIVDDFISANSTPSGQSKLIAVHCTHGLNRTGYLLCRYLIEKMGFTPLDAINAFESSRGHTMERDIYISDLLKCVPNVISIREEESRYSSREPERDRSPLRGWQRTAGRQSAQRKCDNFYEDENYGEAYYDYERRAERSWNAAKEQNSRSRRRGERSRSRSRSIPPEDQIDWTDY